MNNKLTIKGIAVEITQHNENDFISLTDMLKAKDGEFFITDWLRNANTLDYIAIWEKVHNPSFNYGEFATIRSRAGANNFKIGVQEFVSRTNAISLFASAGRYGGTFAHKDIAFEFGMWISPEFKIYLVKEFQRLKEQEQALIQWTAKRELAKVNFHLHTGAIKENLIVPTLTDIQKRFVYTDETDMLNVALFGKTAKEWREQNQDKDHSKENMRDYATLHQLLVLANMESYNARLIAKKVPQVERMTELNEMAREQLRMLVEVDNRMLLKEKK